VEWSHAICQQALQLSSGHVHACTCNAHAMHMQCSYAQMPSLITSFCVVDSRRFPGFLRLVPLELGAGNDADMGGAGWASLYFNQRFSVRFKPPNLVSKGLFTRGSNDKTSVLFGENSFSCLCSGGDQELTNMTGVYQALFGTVRRVHLFRYSDSYQRKT